MELDKLNLMQELLLRYCGQRDMTDVEITGRATATAVNRNGTEMHLTVNIYGDIMDDDAKKSSPMEMSPTISGGFTSSRLSGKTVSRR